MGRLNTFAVDSVLEQATDIGVEEIGEILESLIAKGLVKATRLESGEFHYEATELGHDIVKAYEQEDFDFDDEDL